VLHKLNFFITVGTFLVNELRRVILTSRPGARNNSFLSVRYLDMCGRGQRYRGIVSQHRYCISLNSLPVILL
jgi:hypothetical protein